MSSMIVQLEIALHNAECKVEVCPGHGNKYRNLAVAAASVFPPEREPYWIRDRKLIQESALNIIIEKLSTIEEKVNV